MNSKISVIMPAYEAAATIAAALHSIRNQTVRVHEVIVVDDRSPDDTAELVARDLPEVNAGPAVAHNNGAQATTGDRLAFLDADDVGLADKLERRLLATENPKAVVVAGRVVGRRDPHFHPTPDFDALWAHKAEVPRSWLIASSAYGGCAHHALIIVAFRAGVEGVGSVRTASRHGRRAPAARVELQPRGEASVLDAAASANVDHICDWAGSVEEIDVVLNSGQNLALEAI